MNNLLKYKTFLYTLIKKNLRGKYKKSILGILWSFLNPILQVIIFVIILPFILKTKEENFLIFVLCGVIPWNWFASSVNLATTAITSEEGLIRKIYFPRYMLPLSITISTCVNFLISIIIIFVCAFITHLTITWHIIFLPLLVLIEFILIYAISLLVSALNVFARDIQFIVQFGINLLFYATPVLYNTDVFPVSVKWIFKLNPLSQIILSFKDIFYYHSIPQLGNLFIVLLGSIILLIICRLLFNKLSKKFAEEL